MSKKSIKIFSAVLTVAIVLMMLTSTTFAITKPSEVGTGTTPANGIGKLETAGKNIVGTIRTVGVLVSVAVLMILGIKYMVGSAEEKASYKKTMMPYLIGAVLIFGASIIADAIYTFAIGL